MSDRNRKWLSNANTQDWIELFPLLMAVSQMHALVQTGIFPHMYEFFWTKIVLKNGSWFALLNKRLINSKDDKHVWILGISFKTKKIHAAVQHNVYILTDIMESFEGVCKKTYELSFTEYVTLPGMSWSTV